MLSPLRTRNGMLPKNAIPPRSGAKLEMNDAMFSVTCKAISCISHRDRKLRSVRQTIVAGLELLNSATEMQRSLLLKQFYKGLFTGKILVYVPLGRDELRLLNRIKALVAGQTLEPLTQPQIMLLALLSAAQIEPNNKATSELATPKT